MASAYAKRTTENQEHQSLSSLFDEGFVIHSSLENSSQPTNSHKYQDEVRKAITLFEDATRRTSALSLFSTNEDIDEVATSDIKYLLLPAFLGSLTLRLQTESRSESLHLAEIYFRDFLTRVKNYGLTSSADVVSKSDNSRNNAKPNNDSALPDLLQMTQQREDKIRKYKEIKEMDSKIGELKKSIDNGTVDEEEIRDYYLTWIRRWEHQAVDELASIKMEKPLVDEMTNTKHTTAEGDARPERPKPRTLKPVIITRNEVQKKIYGLGYPSIPTMTVDEFYEQKVKDGTFTVPDMSLQSAALGGFDRAAQREQDAIDMERKTEADDPDTLQQTRNWDDWKDDHRRGWGNRKNMG